jgi:SAM-dependent methyltransferase
VDHGKPFFAFALCASIARVSEPSELDGVLAEQARYYRERAGEYDEWWFRRGRYDHGPEFNARWAAEAAELEHQLARFDPRGEVLELACGTGLWTRLLAPYAERVTAVDASEEVIALARSRVDAANVSYLQADLFVWEPTSRFDVCFFSFWLSHVPEERFDEFWAKVARALEQGGRVFFIDSLRHQLASASDHQLPERDSERMLRRLDDGREFCIVKRFHEVEALQERRASLGGAARVEATLEFFLYGSARLAR